MEQTWDNKKREAEISKLVAESTKLQAEDHKLEKEQRWFPVIWATARVGEVLAGSKLMH